MKEKGYSAREKRVTEHEFNRKMEIEAKMAEDQAQETERRVKTAQAGSAVKRPTTSAVKRVVTQGAVRRPTTPRIGGRGF